MLSIWQKIVEKIVKSTKQQDDSRGKDAPSLPVLRAELQIPQTVIDRYDASQHKNKTREWWRLVIDGGAFIFAVLGFCILYRTLVVTQETLETTREAVAAAQTEARAAVNAAEIARKQMELSQRPWITVDVIPASPIRFQTLGAGIMVQVVMKNMGYSVATDVRIDHTVMLSAQGRLDLPNSENLRRLLEPRGRRDELCEKGRRNADRSSLGMAEILFPGQDMKVASGASLPDTYIREKAFTERGSPAMMIAPVIVGCVSYQSTFSVTRYVTGFIYTLSSPPSRYIRVGTYLPIKRIKLTPYPFNNRYMD